MTFMVFNYIHYSVAIAILRKMEARRPIRACSCIGHVGFYSEFPTISDDAVTEDSLVVRNNMDNVFEVKRLIERETSKLV